jgi:hypothetical protein
VRVPTIFVTPYVAPGTVFRAPADAGHDFDHTSLLATLLKWADVDPESAELGRRVAVAPTFESALTTEATLATEHIDVPEDYKDQGGGLGMHLGIELADLNPIGLTAEVWRHLSDKSEGVSDFVRHLLRESKRSSDA